MRSVKTIDAKDIGGELLPIITRGLYRNALDAIREYIQNSIDAKATEVVLRVSRDLIVVEDNGVGMDRPTADNSIRLGISLKNPLYDVGFRGIGIYSSFDLCDELEIFTKSKESSEGFVIHFDFRKMRHLLERDEERKKKGKERTVYLEKLLNETVYVAVDEKKTIEGYGTTVLLKGVRPEYQTTLIQTEEVKKYLQNVIPLPFDPSFRFSNQITDKLKSKDYRMISVKLIADQLDEYIYRPYSNTIFEHEKGRRVKFFEIKSPLSSKRFGFCWVCHNDDRKVLKNSEMRGILIKKFGFSIASREYLEPYFARVVFYRRLTGELIIKHKDLIPNAARSDFEHNGTRAEFILALSNLAQTVSVWANNIQQELKAKDELQKIAPRVFELNQKLLEIRRDVPSLLRVNIELDSHKKKLSTHRDAMLALDKTLFRKVSRTIEQAEKTIRHLLRSGPKLKKDAGRILDETLESLKYQPSDEELEDMEEEPKNLIDLLDNLGLLSSDSVKEVIVYLDQLLRQLLPEDRYLHELQSMKRYLEEEI